MEREEQNEGNITWGYEVEKRSDEDESVVHSRIGEQNPTVRGAELIELKLDT